MAMMAFNWVHQLSVIELFFTLFCHLFSSMILRLDYFACTYLQTMFTT